MIEVQFKDDAFKQQLMKATAEGLQRAMEFFFARCRQAVKKSNTHRHKSKRTRRVVYENMHNRYAGQPPFLRTGHGLSNIVREFNGNLRDPRCRVGVTANAIYMAFLELGTRSIRPRPWLVATLIKNRAMLARLACSGRIRG